MIKKFMIIILVLTFLNLTIAPAYADDTGQVVSNCIIGLAIVTLVSVLIYVYTAKTPARPAPAPKPTSYESNHSEQLAVNSQSGDPDKKITPSKTISFSEQSGSSAGVSSNQNSDGKNLTALQDKLISPSGELVVFRW
ncbi:MAG TPA: hypothetical protein VMU29_14775 [Smithella sp.]|nr:hypothetical protein [Smithella sp.]